MLDRFIRRCFSEEYRKPEMSVFAMGCSPHGKGWEHFSMGVEVPDETNWRPVRTPVKTFEHIPHDGFYDDQHFSKPVTPPRSKNRQRNDLVARTAPLAATHRHGGAGNHGGEEPGFRYGRRRIQTPAFRSQIRPSKIRTTKMARTRPKPPLGPYPQLRLCGQAGNVPINIKTSNTTGTVPNITFLSL